MPASQRGPSEVNRPITMSIRKEGTLRIIGATYRESVEWVIAPHDPYVFPRGRYFCRASIIACRNMVVLTPSVRGR
jgi:hypothetical protein